MSSPVRMYIILMLVLLPQSAFAAAKTQLNAVIKEIQHAYEITDAFQAGFTQKLVHKESGSFEMREGRLLFKKPFFIHLETAKPHAELLVMNKKYIWNYLPDEKVAYRYPAELDKDSQILVRMMTGQARLDQDFFVEENGRENGLLHLRLYPLEPGRQMVEAGIWVDPAYFIKKAVVIDFFGNSNEVTFTSHNTRLKLEEKSFDFVPPKGVIMEERTGGMQE